MGYKMTTLVENCVYGRRLRAEYGLSLCIEISGHRLLFGTGASDLSIRSAHSLHIDSQKIDYLILSHGYSNHTGGLRYFLELNTQATVVCKRRVFSPKFKDEHGNGMMHMQNLNRSRFRFITKQTEPLPGVFLFLSIDIINQADAHFERFWVQQEDGCRILDTFQNELAVVLVEPEGFPVLSACSHRGAANILRMVQTALSRSLCKLLLGGLHIHSAEKQKYQVIADYLREYLPRQIGVCRCAGADKHAFFYGDLGDSTFYNYTGKLIQTDLSE